MSLFIGNICKSVTVKELHEQFSQFGKCTVDLKGNFAFVDFEQVRSAEQAKNAMHNKEFVGNVLNIEWSRKGKRTRPTTVANPSKTATRGDIECYICREIGHMAKECKFQEKDLNGHKQEIDREAILESIRKEKPYVRARLKSPDRYSKHVQTTFNIIRSI